MACRWPRCRRAAPHTPTVGRTAAEARECDRTEPVRRAARSAGGGVGPGCPGANRSCAQPYRPCSAGPQLLPCTAQGRPTLALRGTRWTQRHLARSRPRGPALGGGRTRLAGASRALRALTGRDRGAGGGRELVRPWVGEAKIPTPSCRVSAFLLIQQWRRSCLAKRTGPRSVQSLRAQGRRCGLISTGGSRPANGDDFALRASCRSNPYERTHLPAALTQRVVPLLIWLSRL